jgi:hypothetical protein
VKRGGRCGEGVSAHAGLLVCSPIYILPIYEQQSQQHRRAPTTSSIVEYSLSVHVLSIHCNPEEGGG